eukprot:3690155-Prymnesium_polylepis.1
MLAAALLPLSVSAAAVGAVTAASGWCHTCGRAHTLPRTRAAEDAARALQAAVSAAGRFDFDSPTRNPLFREDALTSGKMLGVLLCSDGTVLRAFSGMLGGRPGQLGTWHCPGWAGPVASLTLEDEEASQRFEAIVHHVKAAADSTDPDERTQHRSRHKALSLSLSADLAASVTLHNIRGEAVSLPTLMAKQRALAADPSASLEQQRQQARSHPGGIGDCAAPKLLAEAFARGLRPASIAEIWHEAP